MKIPTAVATLSAFAERHSRWFAVIVYGLFALIASMVLLIFSMNTAKELSATVFGATALIAVGTGIVWLYYARNGLTLMRSARTLLMPSTARAVFSALLLLFVATVLVPAMFVGWLGGHFLTVLGVLSYAAFAGLLATLVNRALSVGLFLVSSMAPAMLNLLVVELKSSLPLFGSHPLVKLALTGASVLGGLCAARWMQMLRDEDGRTFWIGGTQLAKVDQSGTAHASAQYAQRSAKVKVNLVGLGPQRPVAAMGAWLGPPFSPRSGLRQIVGASCIFAAMVVFVALFAWATAMPKAVLLPCIGWVVTMGVMGQFSIRLRHLFLGRSGELAELALLPGWENARGARRILLAAVFRPLAQAFAALCAVIALAATVLRAHGVGYVVFGAVVIGFGSLNIAECMRALIQTRPSKFADVPLVTWSLLVMVTVFVMLGALHGGDLGRRVLWSTLLWLGFSGWMGLQTLFAYRRFIARPHPFLVE